MEALSPSPVEAWCPAIPGRADEVVLAQLQRARHYVCRGRRCVEQYRCLNYPQVVLTALVFAGHTAPIEREIRQLSAALEAVKDEQEYIVVRERLHRDSGFASSFAPRICTHGRTVTAAESTNDRVKYWSIIQTIMLFAVCGWQIFYLKRFFEVKRVV